MKYQMLLILIKDKLHYFVAFDRQNETIPFQIAPVYNALQEQNFGITKANLDQLIAVAREKYGMKNTQQYGDFSRETVANAIFARLDWQIDEKNLLTIRDNYTNDRNNLGLEDNTAINLYESTGNDKNVDNSLLATLRTSINSKLTNELKVLKAENI